MPEVSGDAAMLVDPSDVNSIAAGLEKLMNDETLRADLAQRGLKRSSEFSWEKAVGETWNVYQELYGQELLGR
jgi:glycosyltransferase involved in cell wall biosynthesis